VIALSGVSFFVGRSSQDKNNVPQAESVDETAREDPIENEALEESMTLQQNEGFLILELEHRLVVYDLYARELIFETNILYSDLPQEVQKAVDNGIYLGNEQELFDFLESYSS
jgi:hypothetical protein